MFEQECSRLPADENGRVLDRLAGLEKSILLKLVTRNFSVTEKAVGAVLFCRA